MRRVLILGGTAWVGRRIAESAVRTGAEVTCLARGTAGEPPEGVLFVSADRTQPGAYDAVSGEFDAVIDIGPDPQLVGAAADALQDRAAHWTVISTISVYRDQDVPGADESAPVVEPVDPSEYAQGKVESERRAAGILGDRLLIARAGLITGPGDLSDRWGYWPARINRGGDVLTFRTEGRHSQVIDVDDLAQWVVHAGVENLTGTVDAAGTAMPVDGLFDQITAVAGFEGRLIAAADSWLAERGVGYWSGPRSLPLWLPTEARGMMTRSNAAYLAAGGTIRPISETIERVLDDELARGLDRRRRSGLTPGDEAELLDALAN